MLWLCFGFLNHCLFISCFMPGTFPSEGIFCVTGREGQAFLEQNMSVWAEDSAHMLEESSKGQLCPSGSLLWGFLWPCWQEVAQRLGLTLSRLTMIPGKFWWPVLPPPFLHQGEGCGPHVWGLVLPQNALTLPRLSPDVHSRVHS